MTRGPTPSAIPDASSTRGGLLNTVAQAIAGLKDFIHGLLWRGHQVAARALDDVTIYVDGVNGDDANDGLTAETAVETLTAAHQLVPAYSVGPSAKVIIKLAGVGGFDGDATAQQIYEVENVLFPSGGNAEEQRFQYRGPHMVLVPDLASGPNVATISGFSNVWFAVGSHARAWVVSLAKPAIVGPVTDYEHVGTCILRSGGAAWTVNDPKMRFLRLTRGGRKVIFECPIARNGADFIIVPVAQLPDGTKLSDFALAGDTLEVCHAGAKLGNPAGLSITIEGHGGCSGPYDHGSSPAQRGGGGFWMERLELERRFMAFGCWGLSFDRCDFSTAGDENYYGGSGVFVNCLHTSLGVLLHGAWTAIHDTACCRPDVAADDGTADPISQTVDAFSCWGVLRNNCRLYVGSSTSNSPAFLTLERNLATFDTRADSAISVLFGARFFALDQRNRNVQVFGTGHDIGMGVYQGSQARVVANKTHVLGDGELGTGYNDCLVGGATKTWDEFQAGTGFSPPSSPGNWISDAYNLARLTIYSG